MRIGAVIPTVVEESLALISGLRINPFVFFLFFLFLKGKVRVLLYNQGFTGDTLISFGNAEKIGAGRHGAGVPLLFRFGNNPTGYIQNLHPCVVP